MPADEWDVLSNVLAVSSATTDVSTLAAAAAKKVPASTSTDYETLLEALVTLKATATDHGWDPAATARAVSTSDGLNVTESSAAVLRRRIETALGVAGIDTAARALSAVRSQERRLHAVRLFTDVRSIFDEDADEILSAVIVQTLRLDYIMNGRNESIYLSLDEEVLDLLEETIGRAKKKRSTVEGLLARTSLRVSG